MKPPRDWPKVLTLLVPHGTGLRSITYGLVCIVDRCGEIEVYVEGGKRLTVVPRTSEICLLGQLEHAAAGSIPATDRESVTARQMRSTQPPRDWPPVLTLLVSKDADLRGIAYGLADMANRGGKLQVCVEGGRRLMAVPGTSEASLLNQLEQAAAGKLSEKPAAKKPAAKAPAKKSAAKKPASADKTPDMAAPAKGDSGGGRTDGGGGGGDGGGAVGS